MTDSTVVSPVSTAESGADGDGFKIDLFHDLHKLEANNFWFRNRNKLVIWALREFFPNPNSFLEIGCGTGFVLAGINEALPNLTLCGTELFEDALSYARKRNPNAQLIQMDARNMNLTREFDVVGAFDVIEHIEEDQDVLRQMYRACTQGIVLTVPQHRWLWSHIDEVACHKRRYTREELVKKVETAGFTVTFTTSFVSLLLPIMLLSRIRRKPAAEFDPMAELRLPALLNRILEWILSLELVLIRNSVALPVGGSLLLVASKSSH